MSAKNSFFLKLNLLPLYPLIRYSNSKKIISLARKNSIKITKIGNIIKKKKLFVLNKNNEKLLFANLGFKHF